MTPVARYFADITTWLATSEGDSTVRNYAGALKRRDRTASLADTRQDVIELYVIARASDIAHSAALAAVDETMTARAKKTVPGAHPKVWSVDYRDCSADKRYSPEDDLQFVIRERLTLDDTGLGHEVDRLELELAALNAQAAAHPATQSPAVQWLLARPGHRLEDAATALDISVQAVHQAVHAALKRIADGSRPRGRGRPRKTAVEASQ